jgi:Domain of unknown function (DUF1871)
MLKEFQTNNVRKKEYKRAVDVVGQVIRAWDPYGLLAGGAPADEFNREIAAVVRQIDRINSSRDAAEVISRVFASSFSERDLFTPIKCFEIGECLHAALIEQGLKKK